MKLLIAEGSKIHAVDPTSGLMLCQYEIASIGNERPQFLDSVNCPKCLAKLSTYTRARLPRG